MAAVFLHRDTNRVWSLLCEVCSWEASAIGIAQAGGRRVQGMRRRRAFCTAFLSLRLLCKSFQVTFGGKRSR